MIIRFIAKNSLLKNKAMPIHFISAVEFIFFCI